MDFGSICCEEKMISIAVRKKNAFSRVCFVVGT